MIDPGKPTRRASPAFRMTTLGLKLAKVCSTSLRQMVSPTRWDGGRARCLEDDAHGLTQKLGQRLFGIHLIRAVLAASLRQANALENGVLANDSNIGEALRTNDFGVGFVLHKQGHAFWNQLVLTTVPMVEMRMRHDHRIHALQHILRRHGKLDERIGQMTANRTFKARIGALFRQHGVDQEDLARVADFRRGVADMLHLRRCRGRRRDLGGCVRRYTHYPEGQCERDATKECYGLHVGAPETTLIGSCIVGKLRLP